MSRWKATCRSLVVMATLGMVAQPMVVAQQAQPTSPQIPVQDVSLDNAGWLRGHVVDPQGQPAMGVPIKIRQGDAPIADTATGEDGTFSVSLRGGQYTVSTARQMTQVRLWSPNTAPPQATDGLTMVVGPVTRGQDGCTGSCTGSCTTCGGGFGGMGGLAGGPLGFLMNPLVIGAAVAAAIAIPLAVDDDDDAPAS